jgi:dTDP-4-amino-4,6-dideoxygalactose transaminase
MIPLVNLERQYEKLRPQIMEAFDSVCKKTAFIKGPFVDAFEKQFCDLTKSQEIIGCSNGTSALSIALEACGIGVGDEVIVPTHTFIATAEAVLHVGAKPIFVDSKSDDYTICPSAVRKSISPRTRAIIPVHIYGTPCDMDELMAISKERGLRIIEDCAQAHLARFDNKFVGTFGDAASYSFYPGKNLGAYGDAGAIATRDPVVGRKVRKLIDHGRFNSKYTHDIVGYNQRMDGIQAAILSVKCEHLESWTKRRIEIANIYDDFFDLKRIKRIQANSRKQSVYHLYTIELENRDEVAKKLKEAGIATGVHYPVPLHQQPAFQNLEQHGKKFPVVDKAVQSLLSLPICPELNHDEQNHVISTLAKII